MSGKGLGRRLYKKSQNSIIRKQTTQLEKQAKICGDTCWKDQWMACKLIKIGLMSLVIRETRITGRYYYYCGEVSYIPNENVNGTTAWKQF